MRNIKYYPNLTEETYEYAVKNLKQIIENLININETYYNNEEALFYSTDNLLDTNIYINQVYWRNDLNHNVDITNIFNTHKLSESSPFIILNDPISSNLIHKAYKPLFNIYDDQHLPVIKKRNMEKLFKCEIDMPLGDTFSRKKKNGLMVSFYNGYYSETLVYTNVGRVEREDGHNLDIMLDNRIITNIKVNTLSLKLKII